MENPCDISLIRGAAAASGWSVAAVVVDVVISGTLFMSRFRCIRAQAERAVRPRAGDRSLPAISMVGEDLRRNRDRRISVAGRRRIEDFGIMKECP